MIRHGNDDGAIIVTLILMSILLVIFSITILNNESDIEELKQENSELVERIEAIEEQQEINAVVNDNQWESIEDNSFNKNQYATKDYVRGINYNLHEDFEELARYTIDELNEMEDTINAME